MTVNRLSFTKTSFSIVIEVITILAVGFGLFIFSSTNSLLHPTTETKPITLSNSKFYFLTVYEIIAITIIFFYLKSKHWSLKDFNLDFKFKMIGVAIVLIVLRQVIGLLITQALIEMNIIHPSAVREFSFHADIFATILVVFINSFYEEILLIGYIFKRFEKFNPVVILTISFIIRASYHTYQGLANLPMVFSLALVFGLYYIRHKKIWPLIIAHGLWNTLSILNEHYKWVDY